MQINSVANLRDMYKVTPKPPKNTDTAMPSIPKGDGSFGDVLRGVMKTVDDTNSLQVRAQNEEIKFALGETNNTHDLMIAQQKALVALQYTIAVRDKFVQGYQEIMNMQF